MISCHKYTTVLQNYATVVAFSMFLEFSMVFNVSIKLLKNFRPQKLTKVTSLFSMNGWINRCVIHPTQGETGKEPSSSVFSVFPKDHSCKMNSTNWSPHPKVVFLIYTRLNSGKYNYTTKNTNLNITTFRLVFETEVANPHAATFSSSTKKGIPTQKQRWYFSGKECTGSVFQHPQSGLWPSYAPPIQPVTTASVSNNPYNLNVVLFWAWVSSARRILAVCKYHCPRRDL